jgi:hypothetical protein
MYVFLYSLKIGLVKSCSSSEDLSACNILWSHVELYNFCIHLRRLKTSPSPYSKGPLKKIITQIKLVDMSMIFNCTKLCLSKYNYLWAVAIKQNVNFKSIACHVRIFRFCQKWFILWRSVSIQNFAVLRWVVTILHPPHKFERPPFWNG